MFAYVQALRMSEEDTAAYTAQSSAARRQHQHRVAEALKQHPEWQKVQAWKQRIKVSTCQCMAPDIIYEVKPAACKQNITAAAAGSEPIWQRGSCAMIMLSLQLHSHKVARVSYCSAFRTIWQQSLHFVINCILDSSQCCTNVFFHILCWRAGWGSRGWRCICWQAAP